ncbi:nuclear envelope integral membrane protein [Cydia amplana]|uniref:nuclear envelope integral membrane protein n=1 Tax=Cydia amplana TaxID=1869771 RepID=UPI002FE53170
MAGSQRLQILFLLVVIAQAHCVPYDVHWLSGSQTIDHDISSTKQNIDIYCYRGTSKNILALWQTAKFHIRIKNDEFSQYLGSSPAEVHKEYTEDSYGWSVVSPFHKRTYRTVAIDLFNTTCMAVNTKHRHSIELQIIRVDIWRVLLMFLGICTVFSSRALSGNPVFFYLCGVLVGVSASFMVLVYYISRLLPRKTLTYGVLIGGWTVGVYIFQQIWENIRNILLSHQTYMFWYTLVVGFVSFLVCYRVGPPRNQRSKNLVMWTLQGIGVLMMFFSSDYQEASTAVVAVCLTIKYFPQSVLNSIYGYWRRKFPPKPRLLTSEEYYEEGARETKQALESLRKYCSSPDCAQWRIMLKINDSKRFASFVEGDSHLSDEEILDYESYAFSTDRRKPVANSTRIAPLDISDDDDITDDEM